MSLALLYMDELKGFYKSKVMVVLWVGLPLMSLFVHQLSLDTGGMPLSTLAAILVSSIGGTLASVMLVVSIVTEKNGHVYDLFITRPVRKMDLIISKFFAVYSCIAVASLLALALGFAVDYYGTEDPPSALLKATLESFVVSLSMIAVSSSIGILLGVLSPSVLVGVILVIYGGNQLAALPMLPTALGMSYGVPFTITLGAILAFVFLLISLVVFGKRQF